MSPLLSEGYVRGTAYSTQLNYPHSPSQATKKHCFNTSLFQLRKHKNTIKEECADANAQNPDSQLLNPTWKSASHETFDRCIASPVHSFNLCKLEIMVLQCSYLNFSWPKETIYRKCMVRGLAYINDPMQTLIIIRFTIGSG